MTDQAPLLTEAQESVTQPGFNRVILRDNYQLTPLTYASNAWKLFNGSVLEYCGFGVLIAAALLVKNALDWWGRLIVECLRGPLTISFFIYSLSHVRGNKISIREVVSVIMSNKILLLNGLLLHAFDFLVMLPLHFTEDIQKGDSPILILGLFFLFMLSLYGVVGMTYASVLLADHPRFSFVDAVLFSFRAVNRNFLANVLLNGVCWVLAVCGVLLFFVGVIVTLPVLYLVLTLAYIEVFCEHAERIPGALI
mmetsp:Transcript_54970/g.91360  ORF Transcript_54970/g.91360 Transcript_54970/m.91360 type:complete len:252 (+) Transcript_54970:80-835(+)